jgi:CRISPR-associated protein (TIGR02584 family)
MKRDDEINVIALVGLTPAVVTETLYAILREGGRIGAIYLVATKASEAAINYLSAPNTGQIAALWAIHGRGEALPAIRVCLISCDNIPIPDIQTSDHHNLMADTINDLVSELTSASNPVLHASIAGGRKTMGAILMLAMCLHGRADDRISHCLVAPELEADRNFYFPMPADAQADAGVNLVDLSFPRLRYLLRPQLLSLSMSGLVASLTNHLSGTEGVRLVMTDGWLHTAGGSVRLGPRHSAILAALAEAAPTLSEGVTFRELGIARLIELYIAAGASWRNARELRARLEAEDPAPWFLAQFSQIRKKLIERFGIAAGQALAPQTIGRRPRTRYRLGEGMDKLVVINSYDR